MAERMSNWQPIETYVPKADIRESVLLSDGKWVCEGYWHDEKGVWLPEGDVDDGSPGSGQYLYPTHWMPLPEPPTSPSSDSRSRNGAPRE